jgi:hypothetical protein
MGLVDIGSSHTANWGFLFVRVCGCLLWPKDNVSRSRVVIAKCHMQHSRCWGPKPQSILQEKRFDHLQADRG